MPNPKRPSTAVDDVIHIPPKPKSDSDGIFVSIVIIFLTIFIIIGLIWIHILNPQMPEFTVTSLSVSNFNFSNNNQVSGSWNLEFIVRNPNKRFFFSYGYVNCFVVYGDTYLTDGKLLPFVQGNMEQRAVNTKLSNSTTYVDARVHDDIGRKLAARGSVGFDVKFNSWVVSQYQGFFSDIDLMQVNVFCKDLMVDLSADSGSGKMNGPAKECKVNRGLTRAFTEEVPDHQ